jgi:16S rRNA processing protein RimM
LPKLILKESHYITVGRVGRTSGIKGWVRIYSFTQPFTNFLQYSPWYISTPEKLFLLTDCKPQGSFLLGKIEDCNSPEEAKRFVNSPVLILKEKLPILSEKEFYWTDLIQLDVYNLNKDYLGKIESIMETGANDVLVIEKNKKKIMIPYVLDHFIKDIDLEKKEILVDWEANWL